MTKQRNVLLVEDVLWTYKGFKAEFEASGWNVLRAEDEGSALFAFMQAQETGETIDAVVLDLGLPPDQDNPLGIGPSLARTLRERDETLPILAYTTILAENHDLILAKLLPLRISFFYPRYLGKDVRAADLLEMTWQGFVLLSPAVADSLQRAVPSTPDPLNDDLWETLKLLSDELSDKEIAQALPSVGEGGVKARLARIREILVDAGELETTERDDLIRWYRRHYARYCRD